MSELSVKSFITTHTGTNIPQLGFGAVFGDAYFGAVEAALKAGYRHCKPLSTTSYHLLIRNSRYCTAIR
jgi:hypothetical protein